MVSASVRRAALLRGLPPIGAKIAFYFAHGCGVPTHGLVILAECYARLSASKYQRRHEDYLTWGACRRNMDDNRRLRRINPGRNIKFGDDMTLLFVEPLECTGLHYTPQHVWAPKMTIVFSRDN